jgi:hypothetical protein
MSAIDDSAERSRVFADAQLYPPSSRSTRVKRPLQTATATPTAATITAMASPAASPVAAEPAVVVVTAQFVSDENDENVPCATTITADTDATVCCCERIAPMSSTTRPRLDNDASLYVILKDVSLPPTQQCTPVATVAATDLDIQQCAGLSAQQQQQQQQQPFWPVVLGRQFVTSITSLLTTQPAR